MRAQRSLSRFWSLVRVNLKMALSRGGTAFGSKKRQNSMIPKVLFGLLFLFLAGMFGFLGWLMESQYRSMGMEAQFFPTVVQSTIVMILALQFTFTTATLFYASDTRIYLAMPFSPSELLAAKFVTLFVQGYFSVLYIMVPFAVGGLISHFAIRTLISWLVLIVLTPFIPVCLTSLFMMLVLHVVPALRDEGRLTMISGIISIVGAVGLSLTMQTGSMNLDVASSEAIVAMQWPAAVQILFPSLMAGQEMAYGTMGAAWAYGGLLFGLSVLWVAVALLLSSRLYIPTVLSMTKASSGKKLGSEAVHRSMRRQASPMKAFARREVRMLLRTPAYILNVLVTPYLIIVLFGVILLLNLQKMGAEGGAIFNEFLLPAYHQWMAEPGQALKVAAATGTMVGLFAKSGSILVTTFTRDAYHIEFLQSIPVPAFTIAMGKFLGGFLLSLPPLLIIWAALFLLPFYPQFHLVALLVALLVMMSLSMADLALDFHHPKLDWVDETRAVKNNKNVMISSLLSVLPIVALGPLMMMDDPAMVLVAVGALSVVVGAAALLDVRKNADRLLVRMKESE